MLRTFLRSKIHRARVTQADLNYHGSVTIDETLMEAAGIAPFEQVDIYNITNGNRLHTYAIVGEAGSGDICINGAAARLINPDDRVIICCYAQLDEEDIRDHRVRLILVDEQNQITETRVMDATRGEMVGE